MELSKLNNEQRVLIEGIFDEFTKWNSETKTSGGLIDIEAILKKDRDKEEELRLVKINNSQFRLKLKELVTSDNERLNADLNLLGLYSKPADDYSHIRISEIGGNEPHIRIKYNFDSEYAPISRVSKYTNIFISHHWGGPDYRYDCIEDLMPKIQDDIFKLYDRLGKKALSKK